MFKCERICFALAVMMVSTQVLAGAFDLTTVDPATNTTGDLSAAITQANAAYKNAAGGAIYTQDVALISQTSDANYGVIDQVSSGGTGNFAAISQSGPVAGVAYIFQSGGGKGGNMAEIIQH